MMSAEADSRDEMDYQPLGNIPVSRTISAELHRGIPPLPSGWYIVDVSVGYDGNVLLLISEGQPIHLQPGWGSHDAVFDYFPLHMVHVSPGGAASMSLRETNTKRFWCPKVQPLPGGYWLVCNQRTNRGRENDERNISIYDTEGVEVDSFHAGDGIQDVQTTSGGKVWVSYFDEGVYGDSTISGQGLVCFNADRHVTFQFRDFTDIEGQQGPPPIDDCYALNVVSDEDTWLCYYTDYPLVHLHDGALAQWWSVTPGLGSSAIAIAGDKVAYFGGYGQMWNSLFLSRLGSDKAERILVVGEDGKPLLERKGWPLVGRGSVLYLFTDKAVYTVNVTVL